MNDFEVVSGSCQPLRYIQPNILDKKFDVEYLGNRYR